MFIQVIQAKTSRADEVRALLQEWNDTSDEGSGLLGGTFGVTDDGEFIGVVRFESKEKAMANSARPETDAMAKRMAELMDSPPTFRDCDDVTEWLDGGSDDAGFVQVIQGKTDDRDRLKQVMTDDTDETCVSSARTSSAARLLSRTTDRSPTRSPSPTRRAPGKVRRTPARRRSSRHSCATSGSTTCETPGSRRPDG